MSEKTKLEEWEEYEQKLIDVDEVEGVDIKINPDFYIHKAILKSQEALTDDNLKEGLARYRIIVEHIKTICEASSLLPSDFEDQIKKHKEGKEYKDEKEEYVRNTNLATFKLKLMLQEVFKQRTITKPLKA